MNNTEETKRERVQYLPTVKGQLRIAAQHIMSRFADRMSPSSRSQLDHFLDGSSDRDDLYVELALGTRFNIDLNIDYNAWDYREEQVIDPDDEALYSIYKCPRVRVNWPTFGSMDPGQAAAVLSFYAEVAAFAAQLAVELNRKTSKLVSTAEERANAARVRAEKAAQLKVNKAVEANVSRMRLNAERLVSGLDDVPNGNYTTRIDDKAYVTNVSGNGVGTITRTS